MVTKRRTAETPTKEEFRWIESALYDSAVMGERTPKILCPRCGNQLAYDEVNASYEVECETPNCVHYIVRGI